MKTIKTIIITIAAAMMGTAAAAQGNNDLLKFDTLGNDLVISIGGRDIMLGEQNMKQPKKHAYTRINTFSDYKFGYALLADADHSRMIQGMDYLDLNTNKSSHFSMNLASIEARTWRKGSGIILGVEYICNNYAFADKITVINTANGLGALPLPGDIKKSKLTASYIGFPVSLDIRLAKNMYLTPSAFVNVLCKSYTKYKSPKTKEDIRGLNPYQTGAGIQLTYEGFGIFAKYTMTPLFQSAYGPEAHTLNIGLVLCK